MHICSTGGTFKAAGFEVDDNGGPESVIHQSDVSHTVESDSSHDVQTQ
jgi:hypothetical protein